MRISDWSSDVCSSDLLRSLRRIFEEFDDESPSAHMSEYSEANIAFHQTIIKLSRSQLIADMTANLFIHVRAIRDVSQIGRASCRERVCQYVSISGVAVSLKKKKYIYTDTTCLT